MKLVCRPRTLSSTKLIDFLLYFLELLSLKSMPLKLLVTMITGLSKSQSILARLRCFNLSTYRNREFLFFITVITLPQYRKAFMSVFMGLH